MRFLDLFSESDCKQELPACHWFLLSCLFPEWSYKKYEGEDPSFCSLWLDEDVDWGAKCYDLIFNAIRSKPLRNVGTPACRIQCVSPRGKPELIVEKRITFTYKEHNFQQGFHFSPLRLLCFEPIKMPHLCKAIYSYFFSFEQAISILCNRMWTQFELWKCRAPTAN